ncbi:MAG: T9SS type A sorting domain-containing protein [Candidatus Cloacimonetes bacterium]|nr:T9SS type A sorting domain-containing protein [Candidatus Cloacimonadota bacterium]
MRSLITGLVLFLLLHLSADIFTVNQDGSGDYTSIQPAIDVAVTGDTVLVSPGRYYENLEISIGITLASLYLTTNDPDYVHTTVIDGNQNGTCLTIESTLPDTIEIIGFTITNGNIPGYEYYAGGGITVNDSAISIKETVIENNTSAIVGGVFIRNSSLYLSGTTIRYNRGRFGGLEIVNCNSIVFDPVNLCNIYSNYGETCDMLRYSSTPQLVVEVYADTLTVLDPLASDGYFFDSTDSHNNPLHDIIIHANHGKIEPVYADLYVAPDGDDSNSGLTPEDPMQRLCTAMTMIASDSLQHYTIHLADGFYSATANDQHFPLGMRNWVNIEGQSMEYTIIECGLEAATFFCRNSAQRLGFKIRNLQFIQNSLLSVGGLGPLFLGFGQQVPGDSLLVENILIQNCTTNNGLIIFSRMRGYENYPYDANIHLNNIFLLNNTSGTAITFYSSNVFAENIVIQGHEQIEEGYQIGAVPVLYSGRGNFRLSNSIITDCINHNTDFSNSPAAIAISTYEIIPGGSHVDIINCTIGNNQSDSFGGGGITIRDGPTEVNFYNTIIYGNTDHEVIAIDDPYTNDDYININFYNTVIDPGEVLTSSEVNLYYNEASGNMMPFWCGNGELPYFLQSISPCIDTGTQDLPDSLLALLPDYDLLGNPRVYGSNIDIGCYEWNPEVGNDNELIIDNGQWMISNYPNPFNPITTIKFSMPEEGLVELNIYNIKGQRIREWKIENVKCKINSVVWDGKDEDDQCCSSGIYLMKLKLNGVSRKTGKLILLK